MDEMSQDQGFMMDNHSIGARLISDGYTGTLRYIGEVPPTKGIWLGVEWDDPTRGKHDGCKDGKQYFTTSHPTSGSFIRPHKANFGVTVLEAVGDRYGLKLGDDKAGIIEEEMFVCAGNQQTAVEFVGAEKVNTLQSQFQLLKDVGLRDLPVSSAGEEGSIAAMIPNVVLLDISKTLFSSWEEVAKVTAQLPKLTQLNVSNNRLSVPSDYSLSEHFKSLKVLMMNRMNYTWDQILQCSMLWPSIEQLHVCFNQVTKLSIPQNCFSELTLLNLESCPLESWSQVLNLGNLKRLQRLILNDTGVEEVKFPETASGAKTNLFSNLTSLSLMNNKIASWTSVNELNKLHQLEELKIAKNPLSENENEATFRQIVIAKISSLKELNKSKIPLNERKEAQVDYLKIFGREWKASGGHQDPEKNNPSTEFLESHPLYQTYLQKYGPPEDSELVVHSSALNSSLIAVQIKSRKSSKKAVTKKLPATMTVQKLKALVHRLFKADAIRVKLSYTSQEQPGIEYQMDNDQREIGFYAIENGDVIHVSW